MIEGVESQLPWRCRAMIACDRLHSNLTYIQNHVKPSKVMAVLKANAYGHGMLTLARELSQRADSIAVATLDEAVSLRRAGISGDIVTLSGLFCREQVAVYVEHRIQPVIHQTQQLAWFSETTEPLACWLKVNTGMNRLGMDVAAAQHCIAQIDDLPQLSLLGVMTHFACADDLANPLTELQIQRLTPLLGVADLTMANSSAIGNFPHSHGAWVRPGIMLHGVMTSLDELAAKPPSLQPVMTLHARLIAMGELAKGDGVGYGCDYIADAMRRVGLVSIGYGDGYPRVTNANSSLWLSGQRCAVLGRVNMDSLVIDISDVSSPAIMDEVECWGDNIAVEEVAQWAGTIPHQVLTGVSERVPRVYSAQSK